VNKVTEEEMAELVRGFIERYSQAYSLSSTGEMLIEDKSFAAYEHVCDLVSKSPETALEFVMAVTLATDNDDVLDNLAAGPLEDLIRLHGALLIDEIEVMAEKSIKFRSLLEGVQEGGDKFVWERVKALMA